MYIVPRCREHLGRRVYLSGRGKRDSRGLWCFEGGGGTPLASVVPAHASSAPRRRTRRTCSQGSQDIGAGVARACPVTPGAGDSDCSPAPTASPPGLCAGWGQTG
eukprot:gene16692-biopygen11321